MDRREFLSCIGLGCFVTMSLNAIDKAISQTHNQLRPTSVFDASQWIVFFVASDGNDSWSGKEATPNLAKTDGPFATLERARQVIRQLKNSQEGQLRQPIAVMLRGGIYFLSKPFVLLPEDSGNINFPITYQAYPQEQVTISGGKQITGWQEEVINGKTMWTVTLPDVQSGKWFFRQLWVNGQRRSRARYPSQGYLRVAANSAATKKSGNKGEHSFQFQQGDLPAWQNTHEGQVVVMSRWVESRLPIVKIDRSNNTIHFAKKSVRPIKPKDLYYVENIFEALDTPGEWYLNPKTGKLYYLPMPGENLKEVEVIAPSLERIVSLVGNPYKNKYVEHIQFRNLTFSHTDWSLVKKPSGYSQAASGVSGSIYNRSTRFCRWENCTISHIGNYGIELAFGSQNNQIVGCRIFDLGAGGLNITSSKGKGSIKKIIAPTHSNEVIACQIYDGGKVFHSAVAIWIGHSYDNRIIKNHIYNFYYSGISLGWIWGFGSSITKNNLVEFNHIHHLGKLTNGDGPILSDMGAIYTLGVQPGTILRHNIIHDIAALRYGGRGFHLDEGSSYILIENNLVYRTTHGGFHQHYGQENVITNNIFALGRDIQLSIAKAEKHISFRFEHNIIYWNRGKLLHLMPSKANLKNYNLVFAQNLYWHTDNGKMVFGNPPWQETFAQWQNRGMDYRSLVADPLFIAPEKGDFRLKPTSPASKIGFLPFTTQNFVDNLK